jgi:hypothetical protein
MLGGGHLAETLVAINQRQQVTREIRFRAAQ